MCNDECCPEWWDVDDGPAGPDDDDVEDWRDDDPFDGHERDPYPEPDQSCWWCDDTGCRKCIPSRWQRIRWAIRERLDRFLHPRRHGNGFGDEPPF